MLLERECDYSLGMDALVTICSGDAKVIMLWECGFYGFLMDAPVIVCSWNTNVSMILA